MLPQGDIAAEQAVLGAILLDPEAYHQAADFIAADDFYTESHRLIFAAVKELVDAGKPIDMVTVSSALDARKEGDRAGGTEYLGELLARVPTAAHVSAYSKLVADSALLRRLAELCTGVLCEISQSPEDPAGLAASVAERALGLGSRGTGKMATLGADVNAAIKTIEAMEKGELPPRLKSGFADLDRMLGGGFDRGDLVIVAGRSSMGKSAFAENVAVNAALTEAVVVYFSLEMARRHVAARALSMASRVYHEKARWTKLSETEWHKITRAADRLHHLKFAVDDQSGLSIGQIVARCRRANARHKLGLVVVDYLQLARGEVHKGGNREQEIASISRGLKALAKAVDAPVLALSQINRQVEGRTNRRPTMADLRESGALENDADVVLLLYRDDYYNPGSTDAGTIEVAVAKHRNGPTGVVKLRAQLDISRFDNLADGE